MQQKATGQPGPWACIPIQRMARFTPFHLFSPHFTPFTPFTPFHYIWMKQIIIFRPDRFKALRTGKNFQHLSEGRVNKLCNFQPCLYFIILLKHIKYSLPSISNPKKWRPWSMVTKAQNLLMHVPMNPVYTPSKKKLLACSS